MSSDSALRGITPVYLKGNVPGKCCFSNTSHRECLNGTSSFYILYHLNLLFSVGQLLDLYDKINVLFSCVSDFVFCVDNTNTTNFHSL